MCQQHLCQQQICQQQICQQHLFQQHLFQQQHMPITATQTTNIPTTIIPTISTSLMPSDEQHNGRVDTMTTTETIDSGSIRQENQSSDLDAFIVVLIVIITVLICVIGGLLMYKKYMKKTPSNMSIEMGSAHNFKSVMTGEGEIDSGDGVDVGIMETTTDMGPIVNKNGTSSFITNGNSIDGENINHTQNESDTSDDDIYKANITPDVELMTPKDTKDGTLMSNVNITNKDELDINNSIETKGKISNI
eukprot:91843_1